MSERFRHMTFMGIPDISAEEIDEYKAEKRQQNKVLYARHGIDYELIMPPTSPKFWDIFLSAEAVREREKVEPLANRILVEAVVLDDAVLRSLTVSQMLRQFINAEIELDNPTKPE